MTSQQDIKYDREILRSAVAQAGAKALSYFGKSPKTEEKRDGTEVSEADHAANDCLHDILMRARPDYGWLSEETTDDLARLDKKRLWIIDPIDGTRAFLEHKPEWAVSAALVVDGTPRFGIVFNPAKDEWYEAARNGGATLNDHPISVSTQEKLEDAEFVGSRHLLRRDIWPTPWPEVKTRWANSIAYRLALVASAQADATLTHTPKFEWDMAAAALIVEEAGGKVSTFKGEPLTFNNEIPRFPDILAAGARLYKILLNQTSNIDWQRSKRETQP